MTTVIVDSEAVAALLGDAPNKLATVMTCVDACKGPRRRDPDAIAIMVPTTVRVEARWDRTQQRAATVNRLIRVDHHLDGDTADVAARLAAVHDVSPADAHIGAIAALHAGDVAVLTSDPDDVRAVTEGTARVILV